MKWYGREEYDKEANVVELEGSDKGEGCTRQAHEKGPRERTWLRSRVIDLTVMSEDRR